MQYIRIIHPFQISELNGQPSNLAFKKSSGDKGISCVIFECAIFCNGTICRHIAAHYGERIAGNPLIYWLIPDSPVLSGCSFTPKTGHSYIPEKPSDPCHCNLTGLSISKAEDFVQSQPIEAFTVCDENGERPLQLEDIIASRKRYAGAG
ncbi:MAG: hypothetical protein M3X11_23560 [Acidobacteriota bacterium]|nr:hypothetical protein [Acidobacteriota bacterium]